jgi:hypothetical protein
LECIRGFGAGAGKHPVSSVFRHERICDLADVEYPSTTALAATGTTAEVHVSAVQEDANVGHYDSAQDRTDLRRILG